MQEQTKSVNSACDADVGHEYDQRSLSGRFECMTHYLSGPPVCRDLPPELA